MSDTSTGETSKEVRTEGVEALNEGLQLRVNTNIALAGSLLEFVALKDVKLSAAIFDGASSLEGTGRNGDAGAT